MDEFDVVVVGSGFGGSVTAYRVAAAGDHSVCVLERGRSYPPTSFPRSPYAFSRNFWDPPKGRFGLFEVWSFGHMDAIVSAGLGGGSLIYANVLIRKDEHWFVSDTADGPSSWPVTRANLEPHYAAAEAMLGAQAFPMHAAPYNQVPKAAQFRRAAIAQGFAETTHDKVDPSNGQWYLPLLAVTFANDGQPPVPGQTIKEAHRNLHDRDRQTCRLCGECDIGCNYGAKNTLDYNYLTLAKLHGAELRSLSEVKTFRPADGGGFLVRYIDHDGAEHGESREIEIRARHLVLSAGTIGTTRLLLQNAAALKAPLSPMLGHRFSGNGDLLMLLLEAHEQTSKGRQPLPLEASLGPVITGTIRSPDALDGAAAGSRGFYLQDAGYPGFLDWLLQAASPDEVVGLARFVVRRVKAHLFHGKTPNPNVDRDLEQLLSVTKLSADSMPLLGMGRDVPDGVFTLGKDDRLVLDWDKRRSQPFYDEVVKVGEGIGKSLDARFIENPLTQFLGRLITVHALGGCPMGTTRDEGVVDPWGRVHGVPGLHIADGSVMPGPVGPNPSLTIAALADRFSDQLLADLNAGP